MTTRLERLTLRGFKTIRDLSDFELGSLTVLIGPNGAGKSNFVSFFRLLSWALATRDGLQTRIGQEGGASALLHDGPEVTPEMTAGLLVGTEAGDNEYQFSLRFAAGDTLIFSEERFRFSRRDMVSAADWTFLGAGHREPRLLDKAEAGDRTARGIRGLLQRFKVFQFHNTSETARIRTKWNENDGRWLREDGANLAPFLFQLREHRPDHYKRIVENLRLALPFFSDFHLEPEYGKILLRWHERQSKPSFEVSQAADGMLRFMALTALLLQPAADLPALLVIDEPELGLHPYAIDVLSGLIRAAAEHCQVILATQSVPLLDHFEPEEVVVVDRDRRESTFSRLDSAALEEWLDEYSLSELWEKNVIGGRPT